MSPWFKTGKNRRLKIVSVYLNLRIFTFSINNNFQRIQWFSKTTYLTHGEAYFHQKEWVKIFNISLVFTSGH